MTTTIYPHFRTFHNLLISLVEMLLCMEHTYSAQSTHTTTRVAATRHKAPPTLELFQTNSVASAKYISYST